MAGSMLVPMFAVMALLWAGIGSTGSLMVPERAGMLLCMLAAMLLRRDEYSTTHHNHAQLAIGLWSWRNSARRARCGRALLWCGARY
jgi:hypothetical protein